MSSTWSLSTRFLVFQARCFIFSTPCTPFATVTLAVRNRCISHHHIPQRLGAHLLYGYSLMVLPIESHEFEPVLSLFHMTDVIPKHYLAGKFRGHFHRNSRYPKFRCSMEHPPIIFPRAIALDQDHYTDCRWMRWFTIGVIPFAGENSRHRSTSGG